MSYFILVVDFLYKVEKLKQRAREVLSTQLLHNFSPCLCYFIFILVFDLLLLLVVVLKVKQLKGGKESKVDVLVMENLLYRRNITRLYDLKGSSRSRYNPDSSGSNKVLLDQNLIEAMPTSPIFVGNKAKRLLERAVWNDTSFLAVSLETN